MSLSVRHSCGPRLLHICVLFIGVPQVAVLSPVLFPVCSVHSFRRAPEAGAVLSPVQCYSMSSPYSASRMVLFPVCSVHSFRRAPSNSPDSSVIPHLFCTQLQACPKEQSWALCYSLSVLYTASSLPQASVHLDSERPQRPLPASSLQRAHHGLLRQRTQCGAVAPWCPTGERLVFSIDNVSGGRSSCFTGRIRQIRGVAF